MCCTSMSSWAQIMKSHHCSYKQLNLHLQVVGVTFTERQSAMLHLKIVAVNTVLHIKALYVNQSKWWLCRWITDQPIWCCTEPGAVRVDDKPTGPVVDIFHFAVFSSCLKVHVCPSSHVCSLSDSFEDFLRETLQSFFPHKTYLSKT